MKNALLIAMVLLFALILAFSDNQLQFRVQDSNPAGNYKNGILAKEANSYKPAANYKLNVKFNPEEKYITVQEEIVWKNFTSAATGELQFNLYANGYRNDKTIFASSFELDDESKTGIDVESLTADGKKTEFIYFQPEINNPNDSTVAKIILDRQIKPGDSVSVHINYKMRIPRSVRRLGYAGGRDFYFICQWFPKAAVFENGNWTASQYHPYLNFYSDFGDYNVTVEAPKNFTVGASGYLASKEEKGEYKIHRFSQKGVHDFAWFAADEILSRSRTFKRGDGSEILINAYVQPERERYFERYFSAVENSLAFLEKNIGVYPYHTLTLVDVPRSSASADMEFPGMFTVSADLFSPVKTHLPEAHVIKQVAQQYFYGIAANNEVYEAWLDEGFSTYITEKILTEYYGKESVTFKLAGYIPLNGMNLHSLSQIPVVYTVTDIISDEGVNSLENYYKNVTIGSIADTSYKLPDYSSYLVNSTHKPALVLLTLERYLGRERMMSILRVYFNENKFRHPKGENFYSAVKNQCVFDMNWFFDGFIKNSYSFDYKIVSINKKGESEYEVLAERAGDGIAKNEIAFYTAKEVLRQKWDGRERWKVFRFTSRDEVIGAEIDPERRNLLDLNFANNSLAVKPRYGAAISLAMRWFFWVQYALMTLGGIG